MFNRLAIFRKCATSLPVQLIFAILMGLLGTQIFSDSTLSFFYAISLTIKSVLIFVLPFIIFSCVFSSISSMPQGAWTFILLVLGSLCFSNFTSTLVAWSAGHWVVDSSISVLNSQHSAVSLEPLWNLTFPLLIKNNVALTIGLILGALVNYRKIPALEKIGKTCSFLSLQFLNRFFIPVLPVFVFGFVVKLVKEQIMLDFISANRFSVLSIVIVLVAYLSLLFLIASRFSVNRFIGLLRNIFPAAVTAFSTMSSVAALPLSITAAEQNTEHKAAARAIIPATVNVHLIGDSICIPLMAMMILVSFGSPMPSLSQYLIFAFYFVISKFAVAAVPGGGILVMVPILESQLGFTGEMSALITAFYILLDPIITTANVLGNNAFATLFTRFLRVDLRTV